MVRGFLVILFGVLVTVAASQVTHAGVNDTPNVATPDTVARAAAGCNPRSRSSRTRPSFPPSPFCVSGVRTAATAKGGLLVTPRRMLRPPHGQNAAMIV